MNDCVFYNMCCCECECNGCGCNKYISMNSVTGQDIQNDYKREIDKALIPVKNEIIKKYELKEVE